jgi:PAS domain S-box-containing protein
LECHRLSAGNRLSFGVHSGSVPSPLNRAPVAYLAALIVTGVAVLLRWAVDPLLETQLALVTLFGAVAIVVWFAGMKPAILTTLVGYVACQYLFVETRRPAPIYTAADTVGFLAYLMSSGAIIGFGEGLRRARLGEQHRADVLRAAFSSITDAVVTTDLEGRIEVLNAVAITFTGRSERELLGQPFETVFPLAGAATDHPLSQVTREGRTVASQHPAQLQTSEGDHHIVDWSASPIRDAAGNVSGAVVILRDAAERRRLELEREQTTQELRVSEERLRLAQQVARIGTFELNILTGKNTWTPELEAIHGLPEGGFAGSQAEWETFIHPDDLKPARERVQRALDTGEVIEGEWRIIRPDGAIRWISGRALMVPDASGRPVRFLGVNIDVTDRKQAEEATAWLAAIVASSDDAILSKDLTGKIASWNKGAEALFGYREEEIVGRSVEVLIPEERLDEEPAILARIAQGQRVDHYETVRRRKDGSLVEISLTVSPLFDSKGTVVGASKIARDISDRKRAEQALQEEDRRKDEFLATLAHELRTPLAPIGNAVSILGRLRNEPEEFERTRAVMERQLSQMVRLIDDLMDVSRITQGRLHLRLEPVDLASVMRHAVDACGPMADRASHTVTMRAPDRPVRLYADPVRLTQVFSNLLSNACKFTPPRGAILFDASADDDWVTVRVRDSGVGLSRDDLDGIFEMFSQVDKTLERTQSGLGLGLSLAKRLTELHGGTIAATSAGPGLGSEFVVRLPVPAMPDNETHVTTEMISDLPPMRILVVDDSVDSAESLAMLLNLHGHQATTAHDGIEAVERAGAERPEVILLDIGLPRLNGYDACRRIREQPWGQEMAVIAVTGWGQDEDKRRAREAGFDGHLVKPIDQAALMALLASLPRQKA